MYLKIHTLSNLHEVLKDGVKRRLSWISFGLIVEELHVKTADISIIIFFLLFLFPTNFNGCNVYNGIDERVKRFLLVEKRYRKENNCKTTDSLD